jgi:tetraacyldisaccharide 4'-kinase
MRAPDFWNHDGRTARLLSPLSAVWAWNVRRRLESGDPYRPPMPVICVGNIVVGGAGKTPTVQALVRHFRALGRHPHVLTRGYGGSEVGPRAVDRIRHDFTRVGDEALLLAAEATTWVARWRPDGAVAAAEMGADLLIMDDGFQNPTLVKDLSLVVVDGGYGFGNGRVMPAGPCREAPATALARAHAVVLIGEDTVGVGRLCSSVPVLRATLKSGPEAAELAGKRVVAFAGIGRPDKFFASVEAAGAEIIESVAFPDHHPFSATELTDLFRTADDAGAVLVTTAKDAVRVPEVLRARLFVLTVALVWSDEAALCHVLSAIKPR